MRCYRRELDYYSNQQTIKKIWLVVWVVTAVISTAYITAFLTVLFK